MTQSYTSMSLAREAFVIFPVFGVSPTSQFVYKCVCGKHFIIRLLRLFVQYTNRHTANNVSYALPSVGIDNRVAVVCPFMLLEMV